MAEVAARNPVAGEDVAHSVRRLRWFAASFERQARAVEAETGIGFAIDRRALARVFVAWLRAFEAQRAAAEVSRREYTRFAAGLMLRELVRGDPVRATPPPGADRGEVAFFWPEGRLYALYCLNVCDAALAEQFGERLRRGPAFDDLREWESFRENARFDPSLAIGFFDEFAGGAPSWDAPGLFFARAEIRKAIAGS